MRKAFLTLTLAAASLTGGIACSSNKSQTPTEQRAAALLQTVPQSARAKADKKVKERNLDWGDPSGVLVGDHKYIFLYPTPANEVKQGRQRMVVIKDEKNESRSAKPQK